jgi:hypothetical protein
MPHRLLHAIRVMAVMVLLAAGLYPSDAAAQYGARDNGNAATLLVPYFEVDLDNPQGANTVVSVRNASATAVLASYTLWTDWGVPVLTFQTYHTGYDVAHVDLRALLVDGSPPRTASAGQDPGNTISPRGEFSQDINFASCTGRLPYPAGVLTADTRATLAAELTGNPSTRAAYSGRCVGSNQGDRIARGYITIDTVSQCTSDGPHTPGYFPSFVATNQNVINGEYLLYRAAGQLLHSAPVATIQAEQPGAGPTTVPQDYTFYGRHYGGFITVNGEQLPQNFTGEELREPLNGAWALDTQGQDVELIIWRDQQTRNFTGTATCGSDPAPFPLPATEVLHFGTDTALSTGTLAPGLASQRIRLRASEAALATGKLGWSYLNLNADLPAPADDPDNDVGAMQAFIDVIQFPERAGQGAGAGVALPLDSGRNARTTLSPP